VLGRARKNATGAVVGTRLPHQGVEATHEAVRRLGLAALLLTLPATAEVRYPSGTISWSAPHECPREAKLVDEIERLLGQPLSVARKQELVLNARVTGNAQEGYAVRILVTSSAGAYERTLRHEDCAKLTEGAALVMALAIDPERVQAQSLVSSEPQEPKAKPKQEPAPEPTPAAAAPPPAETAEPSRLGGDFGLFVLGAAGMLPDLSPGFGLDGGLRIGKHFRLGVTGRYWLAGSEPVPAQQGQQDAEIRLSLWTASLRGCWLLVSTEFEFGVCVGPEAGQLSAQGRQVQDAHRETDWYTALILDVGAGVSVAGPLLLAAGLEAGPALSRPRFGVEDWQGQYQPEPWTARARFGALVRLP
jgi:hypothetical protein